MQPIKASDGSIIDAPVGAAKIAVFRYIAVESLAQTQCRVALHLVTSSHPTRCHARVVIHYWTGKPYLLLPPT